MKDKREEIDDNFEAMLRMATHYLPYDRRDLRSMDYKTYFKNVVKAIERQKQEEEQYKNLKNN